jgi:hypothetical protein
MIGSRLASTGWPQRGQRWSCRFPQSGHLGNIGFGFGFGFLAIHSPLK